MNSALWLHRWARLKPGEAALFEGDRCVATWAAWARRAASWASAFAAAGLRPGDRVVLLSRNTPWYLEALVGIWWAGLVAVPVNARLHPREVAFILTQSGARLLLHGPEWKADPDGLLPPTCDAWAVGGDSTGAPPHSAAGGGDSAPAECAAHEPAWIFYTSGTTGRPKGAVLTHGNLQAMAFNYLAQVDTIRARDCLLHAAPLSHGSGLYALPHLLCGAAQVVPASGSFNEAEVLDLLAVHRGVTLFAAPTMVNRLVAAPGWTDAALAGLKLLVYGGGPMYLADALAASERLPGRLAQIYGQGETPMTISVLTRSVIDDRSHPDHLSRLASVGVPFAGVEVSLRDALGHPVPVGEIGEVCVRGATVMAGYWQDEGASERALRDGWLWTGDQGVFDESGFLTLKDRSRDLIISGGSNIYPREVEEVLLMHPGVAEVSVIGVPDAEWGEAGLACVVGRAGFQDASALDALCLAHIARFKRPRHYRFLSELPKNAYGKVLKTELRARFAASPEPSDATGTNTS